MAEQQGYSPRTYEELLLGRVGKLFDAKEEGNQYLFDEVLDEIEGLFGLAPELYNIYITKKEEHSNEVNQAMIQLQTQMATIDDEITKTVVDTQKKATIQWEYRSDMLDEIIAILNEFQMIPYQTSIASAEMEYGELEPEEEEQEPEPVPVRQPVSQPQPKQAPIAQYPQPRRANPLVPPSVPEPSDEEPEENIEEPKQSNGRKRIRFTKNPNKNE